MEQLILNINNASKISTLLKFLKTLNYVSIVKQISSGANILSKEQKSLLDDRRKTTKEDDYISWNEAKKKLKTKRK
jgi:hypothetical protein